MHAKPHIGKVQHANFESDESSDSDSGTPTVRILSKKPFIYPTQEMFEDRLEKTENDVSNMQKDTSKILSLVSRNQYNGRSGSRTPSPSRGSDVSHVKKWDIIAINVQIKNKNRQLELTL